VKDSMLSHYHLQMSISLPTDCIVGMSVGIGFVPEIHSFHMPDGCMDRHLYWIWMNTNGNTNVQNLGWEIDRRKLKSEPMTSNRF
jgi:hypothetical protein